MSYGIELHKTPIHCQSTIPLKSTYRSVVAFYGVWGEPLIFCLYNIVSGQLAYLLLINNNNIMSRLQLTT